ncbi:MAG: hypothetical protein IJZ20_02200 [Clostridia bacterium]|nr:hypothetical protein [Clostridia bacterium]
MKKSVSIIIATLLAATSIGTYVFAEESTSESTNEQSPEARINITFTEEEKDELNSVISEKLAEIYKEKLNNGEITEDEYNSLAGTLEDRDYMQFGFREFKGKPGGIMRMRGGAPKDFPTDEAEKTEKHEMTEEQKAQMTERITKELERKLESEEITEDEYNEYLNSLQNGDYSFF